MHSIKGIIQKNRALVLLLFILIIYVFFYFTRCPKVDEAQDLFNTTTLPEEELDVLLAERGIEASVIESIPVWEKQYLIDCDVDAASFGENINYELEHSTGYKELSDKNFSMQVIVARIWKEEDEKRYPLYYIIALYEWKTLPVWTLEDELSFVWDENAYVLSDYNQVNYVYKGGEIIKAVTETSLSSAAFGVICWGIDIKRSLRGSVKSGYATATLCKKNYFEENNEEPFEIQVSYTHNIATLKSGVILNGNNLKLRQSIWARHYLLQNQYNFTGDSSKIP